MRFSRFDAGFVKAACGFLLLRCVAFQPVSLAEAIDLTQSECVDSDGGRKYYRHGEVIEFLGLPIKDQCLSQETLLEYTCSETGEAESVEYACPNGCSAGSCIGPNIIIIGWDGTQWDHFEQCFNRELPECMGGLPNLAALSGGVVYQNTTTNGFTETKPGWTQILTGYDAEVTGVYSNSKYREIPEGYTLFERFENYFGSENVFSVMISGKGRHTAGDEGEPWFLTKSHLDYFESSSFQNKEVGNRALASLDAHPNDLIFATFIFWDPDTGGHVFTEDSVEYSLRLIDSDMWLGNIMEKLRVLGIDELV